MSNQIVPLTNSPSQTFAITLSVDGSPLTLNLAITFSSMAGYWVMSIFNSSNVLLVDSLPLITGSYPAANLLEQFRYLQIGAVYLLNISGQTNDYSNSTNLGTDFQLLWGDTPTV